MLSVTARAEGRDNVSRGLGFPGLMRRGLFDMEALAQQIAGIILEGHHDGLAAGTDKDGSAMAPIAPSTVKRRARRGDGSGPPLSPNSPGGRVTDLSVEVVAESETSYLIRGTFPVAPWIGVHSDGDPGRNLPERDVVGIRPETWAKIDEAVGMAVAPARG